MQRLRQALSYCNFFDKKQGGHAFRETISSARPPVIVYYKASIFIDGFLAGQQCVLHQRDDGHRAYTAGNGGDKRTLGCHFAEHHVGRELEA